jgi:hypothetical protein
MSVGKTLLSIGKNVLYGTSWVIQFTFFLLAFGLSAVATWLCIGTHMHLFKKMSEEWIWGYDLIENILRLRDEFILAGLSVAFAGIVTGLCVFLRLAKRNAIENQRSDCIDKLREEIGSISAKLDAISSAGQVLPSAPLQQL